MPLYEFQCPIHGKFEIFCARHNAIYQALCPVRDNQFEEAFGKYCERVSPRVEFSVPARRNPEHGVQK